MATAVEPDVEKIEKSDGSSSSLLANSAAHTKLPISIVSRSHDSQEHFTLFPFLTTEIRLKIWRAALPPPRKVELGVIDTSNPLLTRPPPSLHFLSAMRAELRQKSTAAPSATAKNSRTPEAVLGVLHLPGNRHTADKWPFRLAHPLHQPRIHYPGCTTAKRRLVIHSKRRVHRLTLVGLVECPLEEIRWTIWGMLPRFQGMGNVKFLLSRSGHLEPCKEALVAFLELGKGRFKDGIVPEVTVVEAGGS